MGIKSSSKFSSIQQEYEAVETPYRRSMPMMPPSRRKQRTCHMMLDPKATSNWESTLESLNEWLKATIMAPDLCNDIIQAL